MFLCRWEFYFAYCEAAFDSGYISNYQITWQRTHDASLPGLASCKLAEPPDNQDTSLDAGAEVNSSCKTRQESFGATTWALFSLYCVLGGVVIARQPYMLAAVLMFAVGQASVQVCCVSTITALLNLRQLPCNVSCSSI